MGQLQIFPTLQVPGATGTYAVTGAANAVAALNDVSDSSYIKNSGSSRASATFMLDDIAGSLPAGAVVQSVQMRFRYSHADRPSPLPYEIVKPLTVLIGRQVALSGGAFKYVYEGYHAGRALGDWSAATATVQEITMPLNRQTFDGTWYADIYAKGGRRFFLSIETKASSVLNVARMYSASVLVNYNEVPVVVVVDPTGTYNIARPTVSWTYADPDGDVQVLFEVKVFSDAQVAAPGFNPTTSDALYYVQRWGSVTQHTPEESFYIGDGVYHAYVRAAHASIGSQEMWSAWDSNSFTLDLEEPQQPVLLVEHDPIMNAVVVEMQSHDNLLDWNQSSGELTTTAGVVADANSALTNVNTVASHGVRSFQYTRTGSTGTAGFRTTGGTGGVLVTPGDIYIAMADVRTAVTARSAFVSIGWYDAAGALLSSSVGAASNDSSGSWSQRYVIAQAPANAVYAAVIVSATNVAVSELHYADKLSITRVHDYVFSLETAADLAGWQGGTNTTIALSTAQRQDGDSSMSMTRTTSTGTAAAHTLPGGFGIPCIPGVVYQASALCRASTVGRVCSVTFRFYDAASALVAATVTQSNATDTTTGWVEPSASVTCPATAVWLEIEVAAASALVSEVHYVDRVKLTNYASRTWVRGGFVSDTSVMLGERSLDDGATWETFRDSIIEGEHHVERTDGEVPSNAWVSYRARVEGENEIGELMTSIYSPVQRIQVPVYTRYWLRDPTDLDAGNMTLRVRSISMDTPKPQSVGFPIEDTMAVVSHDGLKSTVLNMEIDLLSEDEHDVFWSMMASGRTLVLQDVLGRQWYVQLGETTREEQYRAYPTLTEVWPVRHAHMVEVSFVEVARPSG